MRWVLENTQARTQAQMHTPFFFFPNLFLFLTVLVFLAAQVLSLVAENAVLFCHTGSREHKLQWLWRVGLVSLMSLMTSVITLWACGIFQDQGSDPSPCAGRRILNRSAAREAPWPFWTSVFQLKGVVRMKLDIF